MDFKEFIKLKLKGAETILCQQKRSDNAIEKAEKVKAECEGALRLYAEYEQRK
jgi:hypothetical protein